MKTVFEHIEKLQEKPHHIRKQIALALAILGTGGVALVWVTGSVSTGSFAIRGSTFADSAGQESPTAAGVGNTNQNNLAGAAAALEDTSAPARIEIVEISSGTSSEKRSERTIIPF